MNHTGRLRLSHLEFTVLWRRMGLGDKPLLLDVPDHGATFDERHRLDAQAWEQLRARRLVEERRPRPQVEDALGALARPAVEADLRLLTGPAQQVRVLACAAGLVGVVAIRRTDRDPKQGAGHDADTVELLPARPSGLPEALLVHVPEHPRAPGNALTIPAELAWGTGLRADTDLARLEQAGLRSDEVCQVRRLVAGSLVRRFTIGAAARDQLGRRHRAGEVISVLDTEHGRIQVRHQRGHRGARLVLAPTDSQRLISEVAGLIRAVEHAARPGLRPHR